jgi:hypothetical protein
VDWLQGLARSEVGQPDVGCRGHTFVTPDAVRDDMKPSGHGPASSST